MDDGIVASGPANVPMEENEFRLKLKFRPSAGPAVRVFQFYKEWLEATNTIVNEFASHICRGLRVEIKLIEIKEGSADPKFAFEPSLIGPTGQVPIPPELLHDFIPQLQEVVNADLDFLMENVDSNNFEEFFTTKLASLGELSREFEALVSGHQKEAPTELLALATTKTEETQGSTTEVRQAVEEKTPEPPRYNRKKVFNALDKIAKATSEHLFTGEIVTQSSPDGESIDVTPELVRSSSAMNRDEQETCETVYDNQTVVASRAVMIGEGVWSFLWNGKSRRMKVEDEEWLEKLHRGQVALVARQSITVDIREEETRFLKMGIQYKRKLKYIIEKVYD